MSPASPNPAAGLAQATPNRIAWHRRGRAGFSLVEITLAIGIVAFAFVGLFALLPAGLTTFRQAMDTSVGAQIAQRIAGELQETDYFTVLKNCEPSLYDYRNSDSQVGLLPRRYFDDQGNEVEVSNPTQPTSNERASILYDVIVRVSRARQVPTEGSGGESRLGSANLSTITVQVVTNPAGAPLNLTPELLLNPTANRVSFQTFPAMIARNTADL